MRARPQFSGDSNSNDIGSRVVTRTPQTEASIIRRVYEPESTQRSLDMPWDTTEVMDNGFDYFESNDYYSIEDDIFDDEDEMDAWTRNPGRQTTITATERAAFEAIFKNIRNKTKNTQRYGSLEENAINHRWARGAKERLESIMGDSMTERFPQTRDEKEIVVNRYPPTLRALAAKAVGLDYDEAHFEKTAQEEETIDTDQLEELRRPVREEVEAKMRAAETDSEMWDVMEREVFPLIEKLGLEKAENEKPAKKLGQKPAIISKTSPRKTILPLEDKQTMHFEPIVHEGQEISPLAFYGPLYPSYLLLGLRLLDRSFAKPSPLTLSILPKIKSLGLISHVLGASTQLYNELLIIYWYRYDDFRGVISLLSEMEESGLIFNQETLEIINDILRMQGRILKGDRGPTLKALWSLPEFAPGKFGYWRKKIKKMLDERVDTLGPSSY
jgi:hypothetical protein